VSESQITLAAFAADLMPAKPDATKDENETGGGWLTRSVVSHSHPTEVGCKAAGAVP
jgi:hypothetical protein